MGKKRTTLLSKCTVTASRKASCGRGEGKTAYKMLPGDIVMNDEMVVHFSFFFRETQDADKVKASLAELLSIYAPLAGRIQQRRADGKHVIEMVANNAGVTFKEAVTDMRRADFPEYPFTIHNKGRFFAPLPFQKLSISRANTGRGPLLKVLLLHLAGGGSILTLSANHTGIDAGALGHLLMRWSLIAGGSGPAVETERGVVPLFERSVYIDHVLREKDRPLHFKDKSQQAMFLLMEELMEASMQPPRSSRQAAREWGVILRCLARTRRGPGMPVTTPIMHVPQAALARLKERLTTVSGRRLSTNDALCALMWHVCCALRGRPPPGSGAPRQGYMVAIADLRGRHLPEAYCGAGYLPCNIPGGACTPLQELQRRGITAPHILEAAEQVERYCTAHLGSCTSMGGAQPSGSQDESLFSEEAAAGRLAATAVRIRLAIGLMAEAGVVGRIAGRLVGAQEGASPHASLLCTARGCVDADLLSSSWTKFPFLSMDLGNGKAEASYGLSVSRKPYIWNNFSAPDGSMYIAMHVATPKEERALKAHPWWRTFLEGAQFVP